MGNLDRNRDILAKIIAAIGDTQAYQESVIRDEVDDWLVDHPEATTTVQDGSITLAKLNAAVAQMFSGINANNDIINIMHNLVNYGYDTYSNLASTDAFPIGVKRDMNRVTLNGTNGANPLFIKISGGVSRTTLTSAVDGWTPVIKTIAGHTYEGTIHRVSGIMENEAVTPTISFYKPNSHTTVGTYERVNPDIYKRTFVAEENTDYTMAVYIPAGKVLNNAVFCITVEDKGVITPPEENVQNRIEETEEPSAEEPAAEEPAAEEPADEQPEEPEEGGEENA